MSADLARRKRRQYAIHGYCGGNGSGKSACLVYDTIPSLERGRHALSTVRLLDYENPRQCVTPGCDRPELHTVDLETGEWLHEPHQVAHPLYVPLTDWKQLLEAEHCDVLLDEVTGVASSRESNGLPFVIANLLVQLRRRDILLRWSSPSWARADKILRETTQGLTEARARWRYTEKNDDRAWSRTRLSRWTTYDATDYESWTEGKRDKLKPITKAWFRPGGGPSSLAVRAYDTFDAVSAIRSVTDSGRCVDCGGTRRMPECSCDEYTHRKAAARSRAVAPPGASSGPQPVQLVPAPKHRAGA